MESQLETRASYFLPLSHEHSRPAKYEPGPWNGERDDWADRFLGFRVQARRMLTYGHWCGYLEVKQGHPWDGVSASSLNLNVHGGVTFAAKTSERDDASWVVGFDCMHCFDILPKHPILANDIASWSNKMVEETNSGPTTFKATYKSLSFVKCELMKLAEAARAAADAEDFS